MKIREVKKFVKEELDEPCLKTKWRRHTGMLEMYVREHRVDDWHEVISIELDHLKSSKYSGNLLKSNLKRSCAAIKRKYGHHEAPKAHQSRHGSKVSKRNR